MENQKSYFHDRVVLLLIALIVILVVIGMSLILLRFDVSKNPTTIVAWRPNVTGSSYVSGKPVDIYLMALFMAVAALSAVILGARTYHVKRYISLFVLSGSVLLLLLATIVSNALISLQ